MLVKSLKSIKILRNDLIWKIIFSVLVAGTSQSEDPGLKDLKTWSIAECGKIFADSIENLKNQFKSLKKDDHLVWDKDDKDAMDFVAACANIRAHIFGIPQKTRFDIKCKLIVQSLLQNQTQIN